MPSWHLYNVQTVVAGKQYGEAPSTDLHFPTRADLENYTNSENSSTITIPSSVVKEGLRLGSGKWDRPYA